MFDKFRSKVVALATGLTLAIAAPFAMATPPAAPDVTAVVTAIGGAAAPIAAIGGAVLLVLVGIKIYRWVRRAM